MSFSVNMDGGDELLAKIFQILEDEGVLQPKMEDPVIRFKDPEDLFVRCN